MIWNMRQIGGNTSWTARDDKVELMIRSSKGGYALLARQAGDERYSHVGLYASFVGAQKAAEGK